MSEQVAVRTDSEDWHSEAARRRISFLRDPSLRCSETKFQPTPDTRGSPSLPGEQRETRNPGGIIRGTCLFCLDASFRWHDVRDHSRCFCPGAECAALWGTQDNAPVRFSVNTLRGVLTLFVTSRPDFYTLSSCCITSGGWPRVSAIVPPLPGGLLCHPRGHTCARGEALVC